MINYFEILNVTQNAENDVIKASYKALVKKYHPDNGFLPKEQAVIKMAQINEAYEVLSDENRRRRHIVEIEEYKEKQKEYETTYNQKQEYSYAPNTSVMDEKMTVGEIIIGFGFWIGILVCVICCIAYFLPDEIRDFWYGLQKSIDDFFDTFCK